MSVVALVVLPLVLLYQGWTYYVFRARVTGGQVRSPADVLTRAADAVDVDAPGSSTTT
jgi:cytochrome d ubiquinol oxidase subunit II